MAGAVKQTITFRDSGGFTSVTRWWLDQTAASVTALFDNAANVTLDLEAISNASANSASGGFNTTAIAPVYGAQATYENVEDRAYFNFVDAAGQIVRISVPAPLEAIFMADQKTIDPTNALVKQLVADCLNATFNGTAPTAGQTKSIVTRAGAPVTKFVGGFRQRRKTRRKMTIWTLNPAETGPDE